MSELLAPGAQVAGYRITGLLGQGGMGFVYDAEHAVLGRKAALKTLLPGPSTISSMNSGMSRSIRQQAAETSDGHVQRRRR